jgi:hypothetical protein
VGGGVRLHRRGLRLWVGLGTVAGRDRRPAELLGWGLVHAELARQIAAAPTAAWWYVLVDRRGRPLHVAPVRRRPTQPWWDGQPSDIDGVQVWLQLTAAELAELAAHPPPGWARIIGDIHHRVTHAPSGPPTGDPADRFPGPGLRRYLAIRDRRCAFPGCRIPSHRCQADHTIDHARGGPTVEANLASICAGDHALKTNHGWHARQLTPGHLIWTSPLGHEYERRPPRGPARARAPMANPSRPEDDWFRELTDEECEDLFGYRRPPRPGGFVDRWWDDRSLRYDDRPDPNAQAQPDPAEEETTSEEPGSAPIPF